MNELTILPTAVLVFFAFLERSLKNILMPVANAGKPLYSSGLGPSFLKSDIASPMSPKNSANAIKPALIFSNSSFIFFLFSGSCKNFMIPNKIPNIAAGPNNAFRKPNNVAADFLTPSPAARAMFLGASLIPCLAAASLSLTLSLNDFFCSFKFSLSISFCSFITS